MANRRRVAEYSDAATESGENQQQKKGAGERYRSAGLLKRQDGLIL